MKAKEFYSSLSIAQKVNLYNEIVAPNAMGYNKLPYMMQFGEETLEEYLHYLGYQRFSEVLAESVDSSATIDVDNDTHLLLNLDDDIIIGINAYPYPDDEEQENFIFDSDFAEGIIDALESDTRYKDRWD